MDDLDPIFKGIYWEFHLKLLFDKNEDKINSFRIYLQNQFPSCRLSRSALSKVGENNLDKTSRIVTLRLYKGDKNFAKTELKKIEDFLNDEKN